MHQDAQKLSDDGLPAQRRQLELAVPVEALEREVGRRGPIAAIRLLREIAALVVQQRPGEEDEEERDEADGHALGHEPSTRRHRYLLMMKTGVPTSTCWKSHSASGMRMRMQPCDAE